MINKVSKTWKKKINLFKFLKTILKKNYYKNKEIIKLFNKIKPEKILLNILFRYDIPMFEKIDKNKLEWNIIYISLFLKFLNVKVLDITYLENEIYLFNYGKIINNYLLLPQFLKEELNIYNNYYRMINKNDEKEEIKKIITEIPDVLILYHNKLNNIVNYHNKFYKNHNELKIFNSFLYKNILNSNFLNDLNDLKEIKEEISFNGYYYKLDSILLDNYNGGKYSIAGIHCNNKKYIYNGWYNNNCKLLEYKWNLKKNNEFCFNNKNCIIENVNIIKKYIYYCFSFNKGDRVLIYVKTNEEKSLSIKSKSHSILSS